MTIRRLSDGLRNQRSIGVPHITAARKDGNFSAGCEELVRFQASLQAGLIVWQNRK